MGKLQIQNETPDNQQEKHDTYLEIGFKLASTKKTKEGLTIRTYAKSNN